MSEAPQVWLITGVPGSGKTTVSRLLAGRLGRGVHIEGDRLQEWIISGAVWPDREGSEEGERQIRLNVRNQCLLARSYVEDRFTPVLDYVVSTRERLAEYMAHLTPLRLGVVVLAPEPSIALARDLEREEKTVAANWIWLADIFRSELAGIGLWLDNGGLTPNETVDLIVTSADRAIVSCESRGEAGV